MTWTHERYCDAIAPEVEQMVTASNGVDPASRVPTCPEWTLAVLLQHMGAIHRWATTMVDRLTPRRLSRADLDLGIPEDDHDLPSWVADGAAPLVSTLRAADPDAAMWAWGLDQHVRFWSRRMLHETCIHRVDAERAAGVTSTIDPEIARDGIEEFLVNLPSAARFAPSIKELRGDGETLRFAASGTHASWLITRQADGFRWERGDGPARAVLRGPVADLYLVLYGRLPVDHPGVERAGDPAVLDHWLANAKI